MVKRERESAEMVRVHLFTADASCIYTFSIRSFTPLTEERKD